MQFKYIKEEMKMISDDPNIWIVDYSIGREDDPWRFVLNMAGKKIGFCLHQDTKIALSEQGKVMTWVVDKIGIIVKGTGKHGPVTYAKPYRFKNKDEQDYAITLIRNGLSAHIYPGYESVKIKFTEILENKIKERELIDE